LKIKRKILPGIPNSNRVDRAKAVPKLPPIIPANKYIKPIKVCIVDMDVNVDHKSLFDKCRYWYIVQYSNFISTKIHRKIPEHAPKICGKRVLTLASV
jgi:hypothetical protein